MGSSASCDHSISASNGFKSCLYTISCEESAVNHNSSTYYNTENVKEIFLEDLDSSIGEELDEDFTDSIVKELGSSLCEPLQIHDVRSSVECERKSSYDNPANVEGVLLEDIHSSTSKESEEDFQDSTAEELGVSLCGSLQIHDPSEPLYVRNSILNEENICNKLEVKPLSFDTDASEGLNKHATNLCSDESDLLQSYLVNSDVEAGLSCMIVHNDNSSKAEPLAFLQLPPATRKLLPARKGSRAQNGIHLDTKLSVKWAPEVYDPPITSSSHTVKGHQRHHHHHHHRAKAKKDYYSHKYCKGKSSRSSVSERKHSHRRSSSSSLIDPRISRLQELRSYKPQPILNSCRQSKIEHPD